MPSLSRAWEMPETGTLVRISVFVLVASFFITGCSELSDYDKQQIKTALNDSLLTTTEAWDVKMDFLEQEALILTLTASYASTRKSESLDETRLSGLVHITIFDSLGGVRTIVDAKRAIYYPNSSVFELFDSVKVQTRDNRFLFTDYLRWDRNTEKVRSNFPVLIITEKDSISGNEFFGNTELTDFTLKEGSGKTIVD